MTDIESAGAAGGGSAAPATIEPPSSGKSLRAQTWNELLTMAKAIHNTDMVPKALRGRVDAVFAVMAAADEMGILPLVGLRTIDFIDGRPAPSAILQRAMIQKAGHLLVWRHYDETRAVLYGRRRDNGSDVEATYTIDDARQQKLLGKSNWSTNPRAMLMARVTSLLGRMLFADVLLGMEYTPEELGAVGPYAAVDLDYDPDSDRHVMIDPDTGEILDDDEFDDCTPAHVVQAAMFDAENGYEAELLRQARVEQDADDMAQARADEVDDAEDA